MDIRLGPNDLLALSPFIPGNTTFFPFVNDLETLVQAASVSASTGGQSSQDWDLGSINTDFHDSYHSLEDVYAFGQALVDKFGGINGLRTASISLGKTFEGREIMAYKVWADKEEGDDDVEVRDFVVQSGSHAREVRLYPRSPSPSY